MEFKQAKNKNELYWKNYSSGNIVMLDQGIFSCLKEFACQGNSLLPTYPKILCIIKTSSVYLQQKTHLVTIILV